MHKQEASPLHKEALTEQNICVSRVKYFYVFWIFVAVIHFAQQVRTQQIILPLWFIVCVSDRPVNQKTVRLVFLPSAGQVPAPATRQSSWWAGSLNDTEIINICSAADAIFIVNCCRFSLVFFTEEDQLSSVTPQRNLFGHILFMSNPYHNVWMRNNERFKIKK